VAHAGVGGNLGAVVAAYSLLPTQLRIGDLIVRPPEGDVQYKYPEIARVISGEVIIEPYLPNK
ncbi:MAG: septum site-determining protein MinC, partial [Gudongella sp.]|nr:septum site-determining protein MinC [Gudongella sp.]